MRSVIRYIVSKTYKPLLVRYLSKTRNYVYKGIVLEVPPPVFHPRFFFSTKLLLGYIAQLHLVGKSFLELGAGSGLISIYASKKGAEVTATDINPIAVKTTRKNASQNKAAIEVLHSDLFKKIPQKHFDVIAINPPYYKKTPVTEADYAWYCGEEGEYFQELFKGLRQYIHASSEVILILCDGCDLAMIINLAKQNGFQLDCVFSKKNFLEENSIYKIKPLPTGYN